MSRRSRVRKRNRKKAQRRQQLQLPPQRKVTTAQLFELIQVQTGILASIFAELESKQS